MKGLPETVCRFDAFVASMSDKSFILKSSVRHLTICLSIFESVVGN